MAHVRRQIREALAALVTGLATTGSRVYQSRVYPLGDSNLPCLLVNTDDESIETLTTGATPMQERRLTVQVRAVAKESSSLDDTLDQIMAEVEAALGAAGVLSTLAKSITLSGLRVEMDDALEKPVGVASMEYQISYYTASNAPQTAL